MKPSKFSEDAIRDILTSPLSHRELAAQLGCHHSAIGDIRRGRTYRRVARDLPRWTDYQTCPNCIHWNRTACSLGFPDPQVEGIWFARQCCSFTTSERQQ